MVFLLALTTPAAHAADAVVGANGFATGSAVVADGLDNAGISVNPGLIALHERYDFSAHVRYGLSEGMQWAITTMDGRTSDVVAMGLAYSGDRYEPVPTSDELPGWTLPGQDVANVKRTHDFALALAAQGLDRRISVGLGANFGLYNHDRQGSGFDGDLDLGVGLRPVDVLTVGLSAQNILPLPGILGRPLQLLGGVRLESESGAAIEFDAGATPDADAPLILATGAEAVVATSGRIRAGYRLEDARNLLTAGVGLETSNGSVEYGIGIPLVDGAGIFSTVHQVSIRFGAPAPIPEE